MSAWSKHEVCLLPPAGCRKCGSHAYATMDGVKRRAFGGRFEGRYLFGKK
jgi:hypothetical protein